MREAGFPDCFTVINGPEDGAEFPLSRSPFYVGAGTHCAVALRLDNTVQPLHASGMAISGGYRIRSVKGAKVLVNGKRAGVIKSRIIKPGGVLRVGYTDLVLECAPDGLASRSHGLKFDNDAIWAAKALLRGLLSLLQRLLRFILTIPRRLGRAWKMVWAPALVLAYLFIPGFREFVNDAFATVLQKIRELSR